MQKYGLIGRPLGHSFSAAFFKEKFEREGIDAVYYNYELNSIGALPQLLHDVPELRGLNVTIPYKEEVLPLLDALSPEAQAIGAVNVVRVHRRADGTPWLKGYNSDIIGFTQSIRPLLRAEVHTDALVLGTGGASKAVLAGLRSLNVRPVSVSRTKRPGGYTYEELTPELLRRFTVIVNCTPLGMHPDVTTCPPLPYASLTPEHLLYDLVYNPLETEFLRRGRAQGAVVKNGLEMLHLQALASWEFWNED